MLIKRKIIVLSDFNLIFVKIARLVNEIMEMTRCSNTIQRLEHEKRQHDIQQVM